MEKKNNIRSMRFSDRTIELIEQQAGENFTQKFEALVTRCVWELPEAERRLEQLNKEIKQKQQKMAEASSRYARMINQISDLEQKLFDLDFCIGRALTEWDYIKEE